MPTIRYPRPLRAGDRVGVTSPSAGINRDVEARLDFTVDWLRAHDFEVVLGDCLHSEEIVSAPAKDRAQELTEMLLDPEIQAVVPPWGGELAIEILPHLDFEQLAGAEPTWVVGYSDISTVLAPLTTLTGVATLHGQNLMDTPNELPGEVSHWTGALATPTGGTLAQRATRMHSSPFAPFWYRARPTRTNYSLDEPGSWRVLQPDDTTPLDLSGRLIGGCIDVLGPLAGTDYLNISSFAERYAADDGLIVYLEVSDAHALDAARHLWGMRLAGAFDHANAILIGRTVAADSDGFTQEDAVRNALGDLDVPIVLDVDCGHVYPQLSLINGAFAQLRIDDSDQSITQTLV